MENVLNESGYFYCGKCVSLRVNQTISYWKMFPACNYLNLLCSKWKQKPLENGNLSWLIHVVSEVYDNRTVSSVTTLRCHYRWPESAVQDEDMLTSGCVLPFANISRGAACVFTETVLVSWWCVPSLHETEVPVVEARGRNSANVVSSWNTGLTASLVGCLEVWYVILFSCGSWSITEKVHQSIGNSMVRCTTLVCPF